jgi:hypothetical protein
MGFHCLRNFSIVMCKTLREPRFLIPYSTFCISSTISSCAHSVYGVEVCKQWEMARARRKIVKVVENDNRRAKATSPIRKRPRRVSRAQSLTQRLDHVPLPSGQSPAPTSSTESFARSRYYPSPCVTGPPLVF